MTTNACAPTATPKNAGFTLLELMIVVAIIGILAAVAIPAYNRSLVTAAIEEGLIFAEEERMRIELFFEENNRLPSDATEARLIKGPVGNRIQQILWRLDNPQNGRLNITMNLTEFNSDWGAYTTAFDLHGQTNANGSMTWRCQPGNDGTAIPANYLPSSCQ